MERSADIIALDKDLLSTMRQIKANGYVHRVDDAYALFERCQKIIRSNPEYSDFYASLANDLSRLPVDVILDVISISQPHYFKKRYNSDFVDANFLNMAKIGGKWGEESRKLHSFTYEKGVITRSFFDEHGTVNDRDNIQHIANNLCDEIHLKVSAESLHLKQLMKPRFTSITFEVLGMNSALEEFVSSHLKSKTLRKLHAKYGRSNVIEIELKLDTNEISVLPWQIVEGAYNKWRTTASLQNTQRVIKFRVMKEDADECEEFFERFEHETNNEDHYLLLEHPDKSGRTLMVSCLSCINGKNIVHARFAVPKDLQDYSASSGRHAESAMMRFAFAILLVLVPMASTLSDTDRNDFLGKLDILLDEIALNGLSDVNKERFNSLIERAKEINISKALFEAQINSKLSAEPFASTFLKAIVGDAR
ncbi:hypothetical protein QR680_015138 [Steinernema hermaphroditum]|uniref:Uncharacterized protein n=1 Tax=Steinernema hermaphroditum TaxID=289476 RepID=A0AA39IDX4_9BILA|nr:hypothetical protein QR680_015138 [Steinernema hermaphroditum]